MRITIGVLLATERCEAYIRHCAAAVLVALMKSKNQQVDKHCNCLQVTCTLTIILYIYSSQELKSLPEQQGKMFFNSLYTYVYTCKVSFCKQKYARYRL